MIIKIKRQDNQNSTPYYQSFKYDLKEPKTLTAILDDLNYLDDLVDIDGKPSRRISWECSCMQKICGACAMVVNKEPCLACGKTIYPDKTNELLIEPLTKFPVICDLIVDRSIIFEYEKIAKLYIEKKAEVNKEEKERQYDASKCLKCGLCLEICPNYKKNGKEFFGAMFALESYLNYTLDSEKKNEIENNYNKYFYSGCSKAMSCQTVCPQHMRTLSSISYMNKIKTK